MLDYQLWVRREETITNHVDQEAGESLEFWKSVQVLFEYFEVADMSSDETDTEETFTRQKVVRRIRKGWMNEEISKVRAQVLKPDNC